MKKLIFTFFLITTAFNLMSQHCSWCFTCCRIVIVEKNDSTLSDKLKMYLIDNLNNVILDFNADTIFLASHQYPYKVSRHSVFDRNDLPKQDTIRFVDFDDSRYYIAFVQSCEIENYYIFCEDFENNKTHIVNVGKNNCVLCRSAFSITPQNAGIIHERYLEIYKSKLIRIE